MSKTLIVDDRGLFLPASLREFGQQIVFRTPKATIQHFGSEPLDAHYGSVDESHFGDPDELREPRNPDLAPDRVRIKPAGEEAIEATVEFRGGEVDAR